MKNLENNPIVQTLILRDGISVQEAIDIFKDVQKEFYARLDNPDSSPENLLMEELGLEDDYLMDLI